MTNADEFCQFARLGQTSRIQKCLQTHSVDVNALNLYGESALSTATFYNQVLCVEFLLANKADPKLRLAAGHTAVHIACRLANMPILQMLLSVKKDEDLNEQEQQEKEDRHVFECLKIKDYSNLTPIHWAATQESVSKRQKLFAYLDKRMPGVLDSRYNLNWFHSWTKTHPWVIEQKSMKKSEKIFANSKDLLVNSPKLTNTDKVYRQYCELGSSLPLTDVTHFDLTPRTSLNDGYERTPIAPTTATTMNSCYENIHERKKQIPSKRRSGQMEQSSETFSLPPTPITSRIVTSKHPVFPSESRDLPYTQKSSSSTNAMSATSQKTPYAQRISTIIQHSLSPLSDQTTYRAERAHVIPTFHYPPSPPTSANKPNKITHDYDDMVTPISSKRPSHNLLSNIVPSTSTSSSEHSSRQSTKPFGSFGFDTSLDRRSQNDTITLETFAQHDDDDDESLNEEENPKYQNYQFDYLCNSASTLSIATPRDDHYGL